MHQYFTLNNSRVIVSFVVIFALALTGLAEANMLNIEDMGANGDGQTLNTTILQKAIDQCHEQGGGTVVIPAGRFLTGSVELKSNVELHLSHGATLLGSKNPDDYPMLDKGKIANRMHRGGFTALIHAMEAENIAITGPGTIDGQGAWPRQKEGPKSDDESRTRSILFFSCKKVRLTDVTLQNSGFWTQHHFNCEDMLIRGIRVFNHLLRNNDGIDLDGCRRVTMSDCILDADDDCLCFKSESNAACEDITITNCILSSHCNAIKMGTGSIGGFKRITISNCIIKPSEDPASVFTYLPWGGISGISLELVDGGVMEAISIDNIVMRSVNVPIFIRLANRGAKPSPDAPAPPAGQLRNVSLSNIIAYETGPFCSSITGIPGHFAENITLRNIQIFPRVGVNVGEYKTDIAEDVDCYPEGNQWGNLPSCGLFVRHVRGMVVDGFKLHLDSADDRAPIWADDVHDLRIRQAWVTGDYNKDKPFVLTRDVINSAIEKPHNWTGAVTAPIE